MKNKLIILASVLACGAHLVAREADRLKAFNDMEMHHKADWFNHIKKSFDSKDNLLKQQHADWAAYRDQNIRNWQNNNDCSEASKNAIFGDELERAIALHKKHVAHFGKLCDTHHNEALKIRARHEKELKSFINKES